MNMKNTYINTFWYFLFIFIFCKTQNEYQIKKIILCNFLADSTFLAHLQLVLHKIPNFFHSVERKRWNMGDGATCIHFFANALLGGLPIAVLAKPAAMQNADLKLPHREDEAAYRGSDGQDLHGKAGSQLWMHGGEG